jgi:hypothetical protein
MASIATLGQLFEQAAVDWTFTPPPPEGRKASQVVSRKISVFASVLNPKGPPGVPNEPVGQGGVYQIYPGTLNYTPGRLIKTSKQFFEVPAIFSGLVGPDNILLTIAASLGEYYTTIDVLRLFTGEPPAKPSSLSFIPIPPNGAPDPEVTDPLLNISFTGDGIINGVAASYSVTLTQYRFFLELNSTRGL